MTDSADGRAVTGATGRTGRHVVEQASTAGWRVRRATRRPLERGDRTHLDWDDERTWGPASAGSDAAYVLLPVDRPGAPPEANAALIREP